MEDIKRNYEERYNRHTKDRILRSTINRPVGTTGMGHRTFTVHRLRYGKDIQRFRRSLLGHTQTSRVQDERWQESAELCAKERRR